jgi:hypothetical protein
MPKLNKEKDINKFIIKKHLEGNSVVAIMFLLKDEGYEKRSRTQVHRVIKKYLKENENIKSNT